MTGESGGLFRAVYGLRKAAEAEFNDNAYYQATARISELIELLGWDQDKAPAEERAPAGFAAKLGEVRKAVEGGISGNRFYLVSQKLDTLGSLPARSANANRKHEPANAAVASASSKAAFDILAAVSKSRVDQVASGLGLAAHHTPPAHAAPEKTIADGELERRSSEPCFMAELAPPALEPVAAAAIPAKAIAASIPAWATPGLGLQAPQAGNGAAQGAGVPGLAAQKAAEPPLQASAPAHDSQASPAGQKMTFAEMAAESRNRVEAAVGGLGIAAAHPAPPQAEVPTPAEAKVTQPVAPAAAQKVGIKKAAETKPRKHKTRFKIWLDLAFGRKD